MSLLSLSVCLMSLLGIARAAPPACVITRSGAKPGPGRLASAARPAAAAPPDPRPTPMLSSPLPGGYHPRVPTVILLDKSPSEAAHEEELYSGADAGAAVMKDDPTTAVTALVSQMEFNSEVRASPFVPAADFVPARLLPVGGTTLLGKALDAAMDALDRQVAELRRQGIPARRRLLVILTDAKTRDAIDEPIARVHKAETDGLWVLPVGVGDVDRATLDRISSRGPGKLLDGRKYRELMLWIAQTVANVSHNRPVSDDGFPAAGPVFRN